jgi:hypothetical protein
MPKKTGRKQTRGAPSGSDDDIELGGDKYQESDEEEEVFNLEGEEDEVVFLFVSSVSYSSQVGLV